MTDCALGCFTYQLRSVEKKDSFDDMVMKPRAQIVRRTSVTRMSNEDKEKLAHVASLEERGTVLAAKNKISEELDTGAVTDYFIPVGGAGLYFYN